jgi:membrane protein DedA with SNARE-associated domain
MGSIDHFVSVYGYFAVMAMIGLESLALPLPGETVLIAASIYAAAGHGLNIWGVVLAAIAGALIGSVVAFWLGHKFGPVLLSRYGRYVGITTRRIKLSEYLFWRHGGKIIFFSRFVALLRSLAGLLAGVNRMEWRSFLLFNALGAIAWAGFYGFGAFLFATEVKQLAAPVSIGLGIAAGIAIIAGLVWAKRHELELEKRAASVHS